MGTKRDHFAWVETRLRYWGSWVAKNVDGLGYANRTQEGRLMDEGLVGSTTNYREHAPNVEFAHKEHETDRAIQALPPDWRWLVHRLYVDGKTMEQAGEQIGRSVAWVRQTLAQAIAYLAGRIPQERRNC